MSHWLARGLRDISMPGMNGIDLADRLVEMEVAPAVIFCTAHDEYAIDAFKTSAIGYLMKPIRQSQLEEQLSKASNLNRLQIKFMENNQKHGFKARVEGEEADHTVKQYITVKSHRGLEMLKVADIQYFSSEDKYVVAHHGAGETVLEQSLKALEESYSNQFVRVHRNALVSIAHIDGLEKKENEMHVCLRGTDFLPIVSRRHLKKLKDLLASL